MSFDIDKLVDRFLCMKMPEDFAPDAGISFKTEAHYDSPHWPIGTNLFTAEQARDFLSKLLIEFVPTGAFNSRYALGEIVELKQEGSDFMGKVLAVQFEEGVEPSYVVRRIDGAVIAFRESELCIKGVDDVA